MSYSKPSYAKLSLFSHYSKFHNLPASHDNLYTRVNDQHPLSSNQLKTQPRKLSFQNTLPNTAMKTTLTIPYHTKNEPLLKLPDWIKTFNRIRLAYKWDDTTATTLLSEITETQYTEKSIKKSLKNLVLVHMIPIIETSYWQN